MRTSFAFGCISALLAALGFSPTTAQPDGAAIMENSEQRQKSRTETAIYRMELVDASGKVQQTRTMETFSKNTPRREALLLKFASPPVVEGTGMLIVDAGKGVNDIWMYLPATRRLRRVSGAEKSNWFMGTEFTYEDFEDYQRDSYRFSLLREEECEASRCFVVEATPGTADEKESSGYSRKIYWIEKDKLYPVRIDFVSGQEQVAKRLTASGFRAYGRYSRPGRMVMSNLRNGRSTVLTPTRREVDGPVDDYHVSERFLRTQ